MSCGTDAGTDVTAAAEVYLRGLQERILAALHAADPDLQVHTDTWQRDGGGGGETCAIAGPGVFEKGGVNYSRVHGDSLPPAATRTRPGITGRPFDACGLSAILHPRNPYVPTVHVNLRLFRVAGEAWWFGGGFDLTPYYGFEEDARHWHSVARQACAPFGADLYPRFKEWCDDYFYLAHRGETRGIGGLFFDDFNALGFERCLAFWQSVGDHFLPAYLPILERRKATPYGEHERAFQAYRRGRYVEFNLVYDRGTLFGLQSGGRTESVLVSLPPVAEWRYDWRAEPGTPEARLQEVFLRPRDWLSEQAP